MTVRQALWALPPEHPATRLTFMVAGKPRPAGSKVSGVAYRVGAGGQKVPVRRPDGSIVTFTKDSSGAAGETWRADVRAAALEAWGRTDVLDEPLLVCMTFFSPRPRSHYGSGRNAALLKGSAPAYPVVRPDVLKLARAVEDALTGVIWRDDSAIVSAHYGKRYVDAWAPYQTRVTVSSLLDDPLG